MFAHYFKFVSLPFELFVKLSLKPVVFSAEILDVVVQSDHAFVANPVSYFGGTLLSIFDPSSHEILELVEDKEAREEVSRQSYYF